MFNPISLELFPEDCRVVHLPSCDQWVYWIKKNGSSTLRKEHQQNGCPLKVNQEIWDLDRIHVYIREPRSRYVSGVHTFLEFFSRDNPTLDLETALWFVKKYKFLNRHYMPQIYWMIGLSRFIKSTTSLCFHHLDELKKITPYNESPPISPIPAGFDERLIDRDIEFWFYVDQILYDLRGQTLTWTSLIEHYRTNHPFAWQFLSQKTWPEIQDVLS